jgi:Zn-dependent peptidase ImmA (M78 family)
MDTSYNGLKALARETREKYGVVTRDLGLMKMREIYRAEGITIDYLKLSRKIRAIYMCDDGEPSVAVNNQLPKVPKLFSLAHELKHHYVDRERIQQGGLRCGDYNANRVIEIGAEVFAAEFIYPESEFFADARNANLRPMAVRAEDIVKFKRFCQATVSYISLRKRLERFGYIGKGQFSEIQFQKLEEKIFGLPIYKQPWFKSLRARRASRLRVR